MPSTNLDKSARSKTRQGVLCGLFCYTFWGSFPVFFKALHGATPLEIVSHRIFWSLAFLFLLLGLKKQLGTIIAPLKDRSTLLTLCGSTLLIATNWLVFIFAVQRGEVLQSSLGYFMTPLFSVLLGFIFLKERLNWRQQLSVLLAAIGVLNLAFHQGQFPWIALVLASSFGFYGLLRKLAKVDATVGLTIETLLLAPLALAYILFLGSTQQGHFLTGTLRLDLLLPLAGVITAVPLLLFVVAARSLQLTTISFLQYITPSLHFLLAIRLYHEPFSANQFISFLFIWAALGIFSANAIWSNKTRRQKSWRQ